MKPDTYVPSYAGPRPEGDGSEHAHCTQCDLCVVCGDCECADDLRVADDWGYEVSDEEFERLTGLA